MSQENVERLTSWIEAFNGRDFETIGKLDHPAIEWRTSTEDPDASPTVAKRPSGAISTDTSSPSRTSTSRSPSASP